MVLDEEEMSICPRCMGMGSVRCLCAGDFCICDNHGDADCPTCDGEGEVTEGRFERYMQDQREMHEAFQKVMQERDT